MQKERSDVFGCDGRLICRVARNVESLNNLNVINTMRCEKRIKNCALQNAFKIFK